MSTSSPEQRAELIVAARSRAQTDSPGHTLINDLADEVEALEQRIADIAEAGLSDAETHRHRVEALESRIAAALEIADGMCSTDRHYGMTIEIRGEVIRAALLGATVEGKN